MSHEHEENAESSPSRSPRVLVVVGVVLPLMAVVGVLYLYGIISQPTPTATPEQLRQELQEAAEEQAETTEEGTEQQAETTDEGTEEPAEQSEEPADGEEQAEEQLEDPPDDVL